MRILVARGIWVAAVSLVMPVAALPASATGYRSVVPLAVSHGSSLSALARSHIPSAGMRKIWMRPPERSVAPSSPRLNPLARALTLTFSTAVEQVTLELQLP